jgi:hypothetical protein
MMQIYYFQFKNVLISLLYIHDQLLDVSEGGWLSEGVVINATFVVAEISAETLTLTKFSRRIQSDSRLKTRFILLM